MIYIYIKYSKFLIFILLLCDLKVYGQQLVNASWGLKLLGISTLIQCLLKIWQTDLAQNNGTIPNLPDVYYRSPKCQLCFESEVTTATLCGHLFCWTCLSDWLRNKPQCPYCREHVPPSRIIHLMNF